jgi:hypothetical protein
MACQTGFIPSKFPFHISETLYILCTMSLRSFCSSRKRQQLGSPTYNFLQSPVLLASEFLRNVTRATAVLGTHLISTQPIALVRRVNDIAAAKAMAFVVIDFLATSANLSPMTKVLLHIKSIMLRGIINVPDGRYEPL